MIIKKYKKFFEELGDTSEADKVFKNKMNSHGECLSKISDLSFILKDIGLDVKSGWLEEDGYDMTFHMRISEPGVNRTPNEVRMMPLPRIYFNEKFRNNEEDILEYFDRVIEILESQKNRVKCEVFLLNWRLLTIIAEPFEDEDTKEMIPVTHIINKNGKLVEGDLNIENLLT